MLQNGKWIWNYGDFELHQRMLLETRREVRGIAYPCMWNSADCERNVVFRRTYELTAPETVYCYYDGLMMFRVNGCNTDPKKPIELQVGKNELVATLVNPNGLPAMLIKGETVFTDESWTCTANNDVDIEPAGCWIFDDPAYSPNQFSLPTREIPFEILPCEKGLLIDAGRETFAKLQFCLAQDAAVTVYYGESLSEALSEFSVIHEEVTGAGGHLLRARAFRYLLFVGNSGAVGDIHLHYEYLPLESKGAFECSDARINRIREVAEYTLTLNSREFFLDGIKRDRWVWSGDAYQSYLLNYYCFFDSDIVRRTTVALRGRDPMRKHINTILDYSFYWFMGLDDYYLYTGDLEFVRRMWKRAVSLMDFCLGRLDANGLAAGFEKDWVFVDWSEMDKTGAVCAEQMLFVRSLEIMAKFAALLEQDGKRYAQLADATRAKLELFWDEEKGGYIDSFESGKRNVTRHANIFALMFGYADEQRRRRIIECVLQNDAVTQITTPYFQFYQLDSMCRLGMQQQVTEEMRSYWGGMLDLGATSFWEQYLPYQTGDEHYAMYGDPFGCSLCHAWGASPIYLLGRWYLGVSPTAPGYEKFTVEPELGGLEWMRGTVPTPRGDIKVYADGEKIEVTAAFDGGVLKVGTEEYPIAAGQKLTVTRK